MASNEEVQGLFGQFEEVYNRLKEAIALQEESDIKGNVSGFRGL